MTSAAADLPAVTVVVVARNEEAKIGACLASLARQDYRGELRVTLVDDGSTDQTVAAARRALPSVRVLSSPTRSIAANRNVGWRAARTPYVAFLDADCEAPAHWVGLLVRAHQRLGVAAVGGGNIPPAGETAFYDALALFLDTYLGTRDSVQGRQIPAERAVEHLPGLNVCFARAALEAVGGYDVRFARMGEDVDLSRRLRDQGFQLVYVPGAAVIHRQRGDLASWARNMFRYGQGRTWLIRRHPALLRPEFLAPPLLPAGLPLYLPAMAGFAARVGLARGRPELVPWIYALALATHLPYGAGQAAGLLARGDSPAARQPRPKLGLIVLKGAGNKGDEAIFVSFARRLLAARASGLNVEPYVIAIGPSGLDARALPEDLPGIERLGRDLFTPIAGARDVTLSAALTRDGLRLAQVVLDFRALLVCGGQWLHDLSLPRHLFLMGALALARAAGARVGAHGVGCGPLTTPLGRWSARAVFEPPSFLMVRDAASRKLLRETGLEQVTLGADLALGPAVSGESPPAIRTGAIGLSPCAWARFSNLYTRDTSAEEEALRGLRVVVEGIRSRGRPVVLLPTMNPEDTELCRALLARLGGPSDVTLLDTVALTAREVQEAIARLDALVTMRLHPLVFALNTETPFVALAYAAKVTELCRELGVERQLVDLDRADWAEEALRRLDDLSSRRVDVRALIRAGVGRLVERRERSEQRLWEWLAEEAGIAVG